MVIARNIEQVGWNWSGGAVASGQLSIGNAYVSGAATQYSPGIFLAPATDDQPCSGITQPNTCSAAVWNVYRRTHQLSTGDYIWDMSGNGYQFVNPGNDTNSYGSTGGAVASANNSTTTYTLLGQTGTKRMLFGPVTTSASTTVDTYLMGQYFFGFAGDTDDARGGDSNTTVSGLFSAVQTSFRSYGYRCVWVP